MPRVDARVTCNFNNDANLDMLSSALSAAIESLTGGTCRVNINRNNTGLDKMNVYQTRQSMQHKNIELMGRLNR